METITVLIGHLPQIEWVPGCCFLLEFLFFLVQKEDCTIVMGNYSPVHNVSHLIRRDWSLASAPASRTSGNMGLLHRASQMLFNSSHSFRLPPSSQPRVCPLKAAISKVDYQNGIWRGK